MSRLVEILKEMNNRVIPFERKATFTDNSSAKELKKGEWSHEHMSSLVVDIDIVDSDNKVILTVPSNLNGMIEDLESKSINDDNVSYDDTVWKVVDGKTKVKLDVPNDKNGSQLVTDLKTEIKKYNNKADKKITHLKIGDNCYKITDTAKNIVTAINKDANTFGKSWSAKKKTATAHEIHNRSFKAFGDGGLRLKLQAVLKGEDTCDE